MPDNKLDRSAFADQLTAEVDKLLQDVREISQPSRLRWFLAALRSCSSDSVMSLIEVADDIYQDDVKRESDHREARRVANDALRYRPDDHPLWDANPLGGTQA